MHVFICLYVKMCLHASTCGMCVIERERGTFFPTHFRQKSMPHIISLDFCSFCSLFGSFLCSCIITSSQEFLKLILWDVITHVMPFFRRSRCDQQLEREQRCSWWAQNQKKHTQGKPKVADKNSWSMKAQIKTPSRKPKKIWSYWANRDLEEKLVVAFHLLIV